MDFTSIPITIWAMATIWRMNLKIQLLHSCLMLTHPWPPTTTYTTTLWSNFSKATMPSLGFLICVSMSLSLETTTHQVSFSWYSGANLHIFLSHVPLHFQWFMDLANFADYPRFILNNHEDCIGETLWDLHPIFMYSHPRFHMHWMIPDFSITGNCSPMPESKCAHRNRCCNHSYTVVEPSLPAWLVSLFTKSVQATQHMRCVEPIYFTKRIIIL